MADLPGVPLSSGFDNWRPAGEWPELQLSPEARARVLAKIDSVAEARRAAMESASTYVVGGSASGGPT